MQQSLMGRLYCGVHVYLSAWLCVPGLSLTLNKQLKGYLRHQLH